MQYFSKKYEGKLILSGCFINKSFDITAFYWFQVDKLKISEYFMKIKLKRGIHILQIVLRVCLNQS